MSSRAGQWSFPSHTHTHARCVATASARCAVDAPSGKSEARVDKYREEARRQREANVAFENECRRLQALTEQQEEELKRARQGLDLSRDSEIRRLRGSLRDKGKELDEVRMELKAKIAGSMDTDMLKEMLRSTQHDLKQKNAAIAALRSSSASSASSFDDASGGGGGGSTPKLPKVKSRLGAVSAFGKKGGAAAKYSVAGAS